MLSKKLRVFESFGFSASGNTGTQIYGDCIFCGKHNKFYINTEDGRWDCKSASWLEAPRMPFRH